MHLYQNIYLLAPLSLILSIPHIVASSLLLPLSPGNTTTTSISNETTTTLNITFVPGPAPPPAPPNPMPRITFLDNIKQAIWYCHHGQGLRLFRPLHILALPPDRDTPGPSTLPSSLDPLAFTNIQLLVGRTDIFGRPQRRQIRSIPDAWGGWQDPVDVEVPPPSPRRPGGKGYSAFSWSEMYANVALLRRRMDLGDAFEIAATEGKGEYTGPWQAIEVFYNDGGGQAGAGDEGGAEGEDGNGAQIVYKFTVGRRESDGRPGGGKGVFVGVRSRTVWVWDDEPPVPS